MRANLLVALLAGGLLAGCSEGFEGPDPGPPTIAESYLALTIHFNAMSTDGIRAFYSRSFSHGCLGVADLDSLWTHRMDGGAVRIQRVAILSCEGDTTICCTLDVFYYREQRLDTVRVDPEGPYGDVCHWRKEGELWKLWGDRSPCDRP